jgi:DNA-binding response OmpR family regulator
MKTSRGIIMIRILIIDGDSGIKKMLKKTVEGPGCEVMLAADGREGLNIRKANPEDPVITDLIMPDKEGIETIMEFRRYFPFVIIIAISREGKSARTTT